MLAPPSEIRVRVGVVVSIITSPATSNLAAGVIVPIPTFPVVDSIKNLVPAVP